MRSVVRSCVIPSTVGVGVRRDFSYHWVLSVMYGSKTAPRYGSWSSFDTTDTLEGNNVPVLYCKALVHASGGGRRARDWVAGSSAALFPSAELLNIALRYISSEEDIERYRQYLVDVLENAQQPQTGASLETTNVAADNGDTEQDTETEACINARLGRMPEVRCFVYDAMRAAWFHRYKKVPEEQQLKLFAVAARLGLDEGTTKAIWRLVEKESTVARDKQRALENPWND